MPEECQSVTTLNPMGEESPRSRSSLSDPEQRPPAPRDPECPEAACVERWTGESAERPASLVSTLSSGSSSGSSSRDGHSLERGAPPRSSSSGSSSPSSPPRAGGAPRGLEDIALELSPSLEQRRGEAVPEPPRGWWWRRQQQQQRRRSGGPSAREHAGPAPPQSVASPVARAAMAPNPQLTYVDRVVMEIIETERMYVRDLRSIVEDYLAHIIDMTTLPIGPEQVCALFGNIEDIYEFNSELLQALDQCDQDPVAVARCFVDKSEYFEIYTQYCTNYPNSVRTLTDCMRNKTLEKFFRERQAALRCSLPLGSYLLKPVQRILKYHLLLQEIARHYDPEEQGYEVVQEAIDTMTAVAWYINDMKRRHEHAVRQQEIQSLLINWKGPDLTTYGELVLEGSFPVQRAKNGRTLFLFDKMLLITKKRGEHYVYKSHISCSTLMLLDSAKDPLLFSVIHFKHPKQPHTLKAKSVEEKRLWAHHIKRLILENHQTIVPQKVKENMLDTNFAWKFRCSPDRLKRTDSCKAKDFPLSGRSQRRRSEPAKQIRRTSKAVLKHADSEGSLLGDMSSLQPAASVPALGSDQGETQADRPSVEVLGSGGKEPPVLAGPEKEEEEEEEEVTGLVDHQVADFASSMLAAISCWHHRATALLSAPVTMEEDKRSSGLKTPQEEKEEETPPSGEEPSEEQGAEPSSHLVSVKETLSHCAIPDKEDLIQHSPVLPSGEDHFQRYTVSPILSPVRDHFQRYTVSPTLSPVRDQFQHSTVSPTLSPVRDQFQHSTVSPTLSPVRDQFQHSTVSPTLSPVRDQFQHSTVFPTLSPIRDQFQHPVASPPLPQKKDESQHCDVSPSLPPREDHQYVVSTSLPSQREKYQHCANSPSQPPQRDPNQQSTVSPSLSPRQPVVVSQESDREAGEKEEDQEKEVSEEEMESDCSYLLIEEASILTTGSEFSEELEEEREEEEEEEDEVDKGSSGRRLLPDSVLDQSDVIAESLSSRSSVTSEDLIPSLRPHSLASPSPQFPSPQPGCRTSSFPSHGTELQEDRVSSSSPNSDPNRRLEASLPTRAPSSALDGERRSTLSKQEQLLIHKIRRYYEHAEDQDATFSIKRRESLSYIPAGLVRQLSRQLSSQEEALQAAHPVHRKGSSPLRPTSWAVFDLPGLEKKQNQSQQGAETQIDQQNLQEETTNLQAPLGSKDNLKTPSPKPDTASAASSGEEVFRPSSELLRVWEDMEEEMEGCVREPQDIEEQSREEEAVSLPPVEGSPLEQLAVGSCREENQTLLARSGSPMQTSKALGRDREAKAPLPRIISLRSGVEEDQVLQDMEKVKNKVFQLARQYSQRIRSQKPAVKVRARPENGRRTRDKHAPAVDLKETQFKANGRPNLRLALRQYDQVIIHEQSPSPSTRVTTPPRPSPATSPHSPQQVFSWPDVQELRSKYIPAAPGNPGAPSSPPVARCTSVPEGMLEICSGCSTSSPPCSPGFSRAGVPPGSSDHLPLALTQTQLQSQPQLPRWSSLDRMPGDQSLNSLQNLKELQRPEGNCNVPTQVQPTTQQTVIIVERVYRSQAGGEEPEERDRENQDWTNVPSASGLTSGKKGQNILVKNLRDRFQSLSTGM